MKRLFGIFHRKFRPSEIPNLAVWLDAADYGSFTFNSTKVSQWNDKSGKANHASQGTDANRPTYVGNGLKSRPTVDFTTNNLLTIADAVSLNYTTLSLFAVLQRQSDAGANQIWFRKWTESTQREFGLLTGTTDELTLQSSSTGADLSSSPGVSGATFGCPVGTAFVADGYFNGSSAVLSINNQYLDTQSVSTVFNGTSPLFIGAGGTGMGAPALGRISEILIYTQLLNASQRLKVLRYLSAKWNIAIL